MSVLNLSKDEMLFLTDISRTVIPLFAAMAGAYLTYKFSKKDKIRDHLFVYKVKSYSAIGEGILKLQKDIVKLKRDVKYGSRKPEDKTPVIILNELHNLISIHILFLSDKTKIDLIRLENSLSDLIDGDELLGINLNRNPTKNILDKYDIAFYQCDVTIKKMQDDLEMYRIGTNKKKRTK